MTQRVGCLTMDALDCARLARFWADALPIAARVLLFPAPGPMAFAQET